MISDFFAGICYRPNPVPADFCAFFEGFSEFFFGTAKKRGCAGEGICGDRFSAVKLQGSQNTTKWV
jgi:hypothetical protein